MLYLCQLQVYSLTTWNYPIPSHNNNKETEDNNSVDAKKWIDKWIKFGNITPALRFKKYLQIYWQKRGLFGLGWGLCSPSAFQLQFEFGETPDSQSERERDMKQFLLHQTKKLRSVEVHGAFCKMERGLTLFIFAYATNIAMSFLKIIKVSVHCSSGHVQSSCCSWHRCSVLCRDAQRRYERERSVCSPHIHG